MLGSPAGPGGGSQRGLWPLAPAPAPPTPSFTTDGFGRYGVYSLFPGGPSIGGALYSHASTVGRFSTGISPTSAAPFHTTHKEALFSSAGYTFGSPTPPPGSPYSPVAATHQVEFLAKGFNSNIIIHQPTEFPLSPKKYQVQEKKCEEKCYVKSEKSCSCYGSPVKTKYADGGANTGCSRTNPIDWGGLVHVKKEPGATPCQVAEISTSVSPIVKIEVTSPSQKSDFALTSMPSVVTTNGNIPVGIAVARQRIQHHDLVSSPSLPPAGLLTTVNTTTHFKEFSRLSDYDSTAAGMAANTTAGVAGGGALLHCTEDRTTGLAGWSVGGSHNSTIATPTLWQYPAALPMEPVLPVPPVGVQLVRDPSTGQLLLLPTTGIEQVQQAVVWPSYHQPPSLFLPPLPPPPLQLLSSASSDYLSSSTTLHQHTQTHSTRLLALTTTDSKRKLPLPIPATTLIKIETDPSHLDQTETLQAVSTIGSNTGTVFTDQNMAPLVTTHVIYQHPTNLILSQPPTTTEASHRSQATSPVSCLTPPPETTSIEDESPCVQDASNQTETPICSEDDNTTHTICDVLSYTKGDTKDYYMEEKFNVPETQSQSPKCDEIPEVVEQTAQEEVLTSKPDLSGLELLSNSIFEFEKSRTINANISSNNQKQSDAFSQNAQDMSIQNKETESVITNAVDDKLAGLDLLCALAEQRFIEEAETKTEQSTNDNTNRCERKQEKRKAKHYDESFSKIKKFKREYKKYLEEEERKNKLQAERVANLTSNEQTLCQDASSDMYECEETVHRSYKSRESEKEVKKFIASKTQTNYTKDEWPEMNPSELDMRLKLAELQRQYKEKQRELHKLKPKRKSLDEKESKKRKSRKKSTYSERSVTPPPLLDKMDVPVTPNKYELLKPPTLCPVSSHKASPIIVELKKDYNSSGPDLSDSSPEKISSSKKRKVGRPKKLLSANDQRTGTETIVAKKPKAAGSFVGYLLAAKQKLQMQNKETPVRTLSPPRYVEEPKKKSKKAKLNNNTIIHPSAMKKLPESVSKIRPKLKAEPMVKTYVEEEENNDWEETEENEEHSQTPVKENVVELKEPDIEIVEEEQLEEERLEEEQLEVKLNEPVKLKDTRCILTAEHLEKDKMRVLTAMGGLFYAGHLKAVEPPDVYSISLDGERGNRPHIMSREEILRDAIVEVAPTSTKELITGTRVCAYWSQQYRCLYPGSIADPGTPDPILDSKFVSVEFDDGDSGRIAREDIRYLPSDYPFVEYDPNPLLSLSKRRRRTSLNSITMEERRLSDCVSSPFQVIQEAIKPTEVVEDNQDVNQVAQSSADHQERKRLKKKKREKLREKLAHVDKKKHKKCKCGDENCQRRKHHKKHKKHKKRHRGESSNGDDAAYSVEQNGQEDTSLPDSTQAALVSLPNSPSDSEMDVDVDPTNQVTIDDLDAKSKKLKKRDRQESSESRSKMSAFLYKKQLWSWSGGSYRRKTKSRQKKDFYKEIKRDSELIKVGDSAVFLSTSTPDRPYIGKIISMWEMNGSMKVKVKWFYHPEETKKCSPLEIPGALFESPHEDDNDVQTISHKCEVVSLAEFNEVLEKDRERLAAIYDNNDLYYLAGHYDPKNDILRIENGIPGNIDSQQ